MLVKAFIIVDNSSRLLDDHRQRIWVKAFGYDGVGARSIEEPSNMKEMKRYEKKRSYSQSNKKCLRLVKSFSPAIL